VGQRLGLFVSMGVTLIVANPAPPIWAAQRPALTADMLAQTYWTPRRAQCLLTLLAGSKAEQTCETHPGTLHNLTTSQGTYAVSGQHVVVRLPRETLTFHRAGVPATWLGNEAPESLIQSDRTVYQNIGEAAAMARGMSHAPPASKEPWAL